MTVNVNVTILMMKFSLILFGIILFLGRLYFATVRQSIGPTLKTKSNASIHYLCVDDDLVYEG